MSESTQEVEMGTQPVKEHEWLQSLVGEWITKTEMNMPDGNSMTTDGRETVKSLGGLWAFAEATGEMPDGSSSTSYTSLGYDVSFKEYRGCWFGSFSSHLWKYVGTLSEDGKTMTLDCEGPDMEEDGKTALYKDVITLIDKNHRKLTSYWQDKSGEWQIAMTTEYTRAM